MKERDALILGIWHLGFSSLQPKVGFWEEVGNRCSFMQGEGSGPAWPQLCSLHGSGMHIVISHDVQIPPEVKAPRECASRGPCSSLGLLSLRSCRYWGGLVPLHEGRETYGGFVYRFQWDDRWAKSASADCIKFNEVELEHNK